MSDDLPDDAHAVQYIELSNLPHVPTAHELVQIASAHAGRMIAQFGRLAPLYHAVRSNGTHVVLPPPTDDKDTSNELVRALFEQLDVDRYVYVDEAWRCTSTDEQQLRAYMAQHGSLEDHPDRTEMVMISVETVGEQLWAHHEIKRDPHGRPTLGPLEIEPSAVRAEGRMVGLLPRPKGARLQ
jgi:hypothetical protein